MMKTALAILMALVVAACSAPQEAEPQLTPSPSASLPVVGTPVIDVPVTSTSIDDRPAAAAIAPVTLYIEDLDISMPIVPVGVEPDGNMEIPVSALEAGWYRFGAGPLNEEGNVVLAAHVDDARVGLGPFARLKDAEVGSHITVTVESGESVEYQVVRVEQTDKDQVDTELVFATTDQPHLVLVTCGGSFDWSVRSYSDNVMVWAVPVEGAG